MKFKVFASAVLMTITATSLSATELVFEMFDTVPQSTPITNLTDWTCAPGDIPGMVTNSRSFSPNYSVELPVAPGAPGATNSSMVLTGGEAYTWTCADNPTIRISARIFCSATNQTISMRGGSASGEQWIVRFDGADGHIKLNGVDTGALFIIGRYADIALYYNVPGNTASLDYDGSNIVSQAALGGTPTTLFNHVGFYRETAEIGPVFIDNVVIEVFPSSTTAWWRFEEGPDDHVADHTGLFPVSECSLLAGYREWLSGDSRMVHDGHGGFNNTHAFAGPELTRIFVGSHLITPTWTVEGLIRIEPGAQNVELFELGVGLGFNSSNSWISISWQQSWQSVAFSLRDNAQSTTQSDTSYNTNALLSADGQQHHFACVKTNNLLITYIDYIPRSTNVLGGVSLGVYEFNTNAYASVGEALNYGNSSSIDHVFDEIRLSNKALSPDTFLHAYGSTPANDFDGDGASDLGVLDQGTGRWFVRTVGGAQLAYSENWGWSGVEAVAGDYDGNGVGDLAVFDQTTGRWFIRSLAGAILAWDVNWGWPGVEPVSGDFDGDGIDDLAVFDQNTGRWFIRTVSGDILAWSVFWGWPGVQPVSGDYDGDGVDDLAVLDQNTGRWFVRNLAGDILAWEINWGWAGVTGVSGDFDGDAKSDLAVFDVLTGRWFIRTVLGDILAWNINWGWPSVRPVSGDFDGDGVSDLAIFDEASGRWFIRSPAGEIIGWNINWGWSGVQPVGR